MSVTPIQNPEDKVTQLELAGIFYNIVKSMKAQYDNILDEQYFPKFPFLETQTIIDLLSVFSAEVIREASIIEGNPNTSKARLRLLSNAVAKHIQDTCNNYANDMIDNDDMK